MAPMLIRGAISGTIASEDHFGIVAEEIARLQVGNTVFPFTPGPGNDTDGFELGGSIDVVAREIAR